MLNLNIHEIEYRCEFNGYNYRFICNISSGTKIYRHRQNFGGFYCAPSVQNMTINGDFEPMLVTASVDIASFHTLSAAVEALSKYVES